MMAEGESLVTFARKTVDFQHLNRVVLITLLSEITWAGYCCHCSASLPCWYSNLETQEWMFENRLQLRFCEDGHWMSECVWGPQVWRMRLWWLTSGPAGSHLFCFGIGSSRDVLSELTSEMCPGSCLSWENSEQNCKYWATDYWVITFISKWECLPFLEGRPWDRGWG